jgi:hypothetical protein
MVYPVLEHRSGRVVVLPEAAGYALVLDGQILAHYRRFAWAQRRFEQVCQSLIANR